MTCHWNKLKYFRLFWNMLNQLENIVRYFYRMKHLLCWLNFRLKQLPNFIEISLQALLSDFYQYGKMCLISFVLTNSPFRSVLIWLTCRSDLRLFVLFCFELFCFDLIRLTCRSDQRRPAWSCSPSPLCLRRRSRSWRPARDRSSCWSAQPRSSKLPIWLGLVCKRVREVSLFQIQIKLLHFSL